MAKILSPGMLSARNDYMQQRAQAEAAASAANSQPTAQTGIGTPATQPVPASNTAPGDASLVEAYIRGVQNKIDGNKPGNITVPSQTVLGQWLELYRSQLEHPVVQDWMREQKIDPSSVTVIPSTGAMSAKVDGVRKDFSLTDGSGWGQVSGPLLAAGKIIVPGDGQELRVGLSADTAKVSVAVVARFYGEPSPSNRTQGQAQIKRLEQNKSFDAISPDDRLRPANLRSAQALETQKANAETFYSAAPQKLAFTHLAVGVANAYPNVHDEAKRWAGEIIEKETGQKNVDPDTLFFNRFRHNQSASPGTATGAMHLDEEPFYSKNLPDALLDNFSEHDQIPGQLDAEAGIYTVGRGASTQGGYGANNQFPLAPSTLMHASWKTDFQSRMTTKIDQFWSAHGDDYRTALKGEFTQQARQQLKGFEAKTPIEQKLMPDEEKFTRGDYKIVMGAVSNLPLDENAPLTVAQLQAQAPTSGKVRAHAFDINGWGSSDIIRFAEVDDGQYNFENNRRDGTQILYIPGNTPAFLRFDSLQKMDDWVVDQAKDPKKRERLASHFSLYNRQDGGIFGKFGVDAALGHLASGNWDNAEGNTIDRANIKIAGDVFSHMTEQAKARMTRDADTAIKSSSEVTRDTWLNDISAAAGLLGKLAPLGAPAAVAAVGVGITETALGAEKSASGDTKAERSDGAWKAFDGTLNTLFSAGASGRVEDPFIEPETPVTSTQELPPAGGEPIAGPSSGRAANTVPAIPSGPSLIKMSDYAVPDGEALISDATRNSQGVYQIKGSNGLYRRFVRHTDETGKRQVFELESRYRMGDISSQIIDPNTGRAVMRVHPGADGDWVRAPADGSGKWPWQRKVSTTVSTEPKVPPMISDQFLELDGSKMKGADILDKYLNLGENKYTYGIAVNEEGESVPQISWTAEEDPAKATPHPTASASTFGTSDYSEQFIKDINRSKFTIQKPDGTKLEIDIGNEVKTLELEKGDKLSTAELDQVIQKNILNIEEFIPDPALRARISEVANQWLLGAAPDEFQTSRFKGTVFGSGRDPHYYINYDPKGTATTVTAKSDFIINKLDDNNGELDTLTDINVKSTRTITIRRNNEVNGDGYDIDPSAPTRIEITPKLG
ncbi:dermonecrotic toxin domain-containing protein [Pseudomonas sp. K2I15]|uniref:dermonecrotic toxin domain-containing protein n=1 Tax=unclassified Pseudomonas TaxID=196821 RepID=UPI000B4D0BF8|nr:DUF6543 domain-containing protein [Pseudomonas sp. K2I15]OWP72985.1 hypothetical protein CEC48_04725 [Pseudomonas sp. K2I15]